MSEVAPLAEGVSTVADKSRLSLTPRDLLCLTLGIGIGWGLKHIRKMLNQ